MLLFFGFLCTFIHIYTLQQQAVEELLICHTMDIAFFFTLVLASFIMVLLMGIGVAITMPFHGALVRLRSNYNPRAVGLEGVENRYVWLWVMFVSHIDMYGHRGVLRWWQSTENDVLIMQCWAYAHHIDRDAETHQTVRGVVWAI